MRNNAAVWVMQSMETAVAAIPFAVTGLDFDIHTECVGIRVPPRDSDRNARLVTPCLLRVVAPEYRI